MPRPLLVLVLLSACSSDRPQVKTPPEVVAAEPQAAGPGLPPPPALGPGQSRAQVTGCSKSEQPSEQDGATYPPVVLGSQAPSATEVQLGSQPGGVWVAHNLTHGCCQKARIYVQQLAGQVNFVEAMEGNPCGTCMCTSQVQAAVGVPPGRYAVALRLEDTAGSTVVKQSSFVVEAY